MKSTAQESHKTINLYVFNLPLLLLVLALAGGGAYAATQYQIRIGDKSKIEIKKRNMIGEKIVPSIADNPEGLQQISVTEDELNILIAQKAVGRGVGDFALSKASVKLAESLLTFEAELSDGTSVSGEVQVGDDGRSIETVSVNVESGGMFAGVKEKVIKIAINQAFSQILNSYGDKFEYVEIKNELLIIYFSKSE